MTPSQIFLKIADPQDSETGSRPSAGLCRSGNSLAAHVVDSLKHRIYIA